MEEKQVHKGRIILLISLIVIVFVAFALKLMQYQIVNAEEYKEMAQGNYTSVQSIDAARGEILDRYGRPLAVNQVSYDIMINEAYLPADMKNTVIERIILLMEQEGQTWIDTLPISTTEPFTFLTETDSQKTQIEKLKTQIHTLGIFNRKEDQTSKLDFTGYTNMQRLYVNDNGLTEIKLGGCTSLWRLVADGNAFEEIDLSEVDRYPENDYLMGNNPNLKRIYVWKGFTLDYYNNFSYDKENNVQIIEK